MEPDTVPSAAPRRLGTSKISSHPDPAAGEKGPWFSCDTAGPSNPFQGSTSHCCCPLSGQQGCYSGDRSHPLTAGTESVDGLASASSYPAFWTASYTPHQVIPGGTEEEKVMKAKSQW